VDPDGSMREELPPITQFLNRVLALRIAMQNRLIAAFEERLDARLEAAAAASTYDVGIETLTAKSFRIVERRTVHTHAATGAEMRRYRVLRKARNRPFPLVEALALREAPAVSS
jgi:low affinity Fe/Cu permease